MESILSKPNWLNQMSLGNHACFFYTTGAEFFSIAAPFFREGLESQKERCLWILPPSLSFMKARQDLEELLPFDLDPLLKIRRLMMIPWEKWYGQELSIQELLNRGRQLLRETLREGYSILRILGHSPAKSSQYWKDFLVYEETLSRTSKPKPFISLCAYSLMDCPAAAISPIASNHSLCLIHHGTEWEWLKSRPTNPLQSHLFHHKHA